jgi:hypothetical protein
VARHAQLEVAVGRLEQVDAVRVPSSSAARHARVRRSA